MDNRISLLITHLESNLHQRFSINQIAQLIRISPSRLQHIFKEETGLSINQYLRKLRLQKAAWLLSCSFLSVKEIRCSVGIVDTRHFADAFKREFGMTPSCYRKEHFNLESAELIKNIQTAESAIKQQEKLIAF
jgi:transcriptional regulator GlxA family with amidase domain